MIFKCGIIGLPNVGKSTLFNALTKSNVEASNFPFCTIHPNVGSLSIFDDRLSKIAEIVKPQRITPATMKFVDIAGLIKGASQGKGLGNKFLVNIRETDIISHVVRCFNDNNVTHFIGEVNPLNDINIINNELMLFDLSMCETAIYRIRKKINNSNKNLKMNLTLLEKCFSHLENAKMLRFLNLNQEEKDILKCFGFLTLKPIIYVANVDKDGFKNNPYLDQIKKIAKIENSVVVFLCAKIESDIAKLNEEARTKFMSKLNIKDRKIQYLIQSGCKLLNLQTYFTVNMKNVHAWLVPIMTSAKEAAGKVHTDFKKGFIRVQIISYKDFITYKGMQGAKKFGKMRTEGKDYMIKDGDIVHFLFKI